LCIYTYLFLIQEWESNEGATGGNSSGPRVGTTIVKNIIILCLFKENNNIHSYCHRLSQHYMIILCSRDTKHINYFVIAEHFWECIFSFSFETNQKYHIAHESLLNVLFVFDRNSRKYIILFDYRYYIIYYTLILYIIIYIYIILYQIYSIRGRGWLYLRNVFAFYDPCLRIYI